MKVWNVIKLCFSGFYSLLQDGASVFSMICLAVIAIVTFFKPVIGSAALTAFATVTPACLGYFQHKITLAQMAQIQQSSTTTTITNVNPSDLPSRGQ